MVSLFTLTTKLSASFIIAFIVTTIAIVYILRTPHIILQNENMVDKHYYINTTHTLTNDLLSGVGILMIAQLIIYTADINHSLLRIAVVAGVVLLTSFIRTIDVVGNDVKTNTNAVWYKPNTYIQSTIYDMIYMVTLYIVLTAIFAYVL